MLMFVLLLVAYGMPAAQSQSLQPAQQPAGVSIPANTCGNLTGHTFRGEVSRSLSRVFGDVDPRAEVARLYPFLADAKDAELSKGVHFYTSLSFPGGQQGEAAVLEFEASPMVKRFRCRVRVVGGTTGATAGSSITLDPQPCPAFLADPILHGDSDREAGHFVIPCSQGPDGALGLSVRSICPNLPLLKEEGPHVTGGTGSGI